MKTVVICPMQEELDFFDQGCNTLGYKTEPISIGRISGLHISDLGLVLAQGGLGKAQFGVQTQHLIDSGPDWDAVICAGAAGALSDRLAVGDVVIGIETIEFDIRNKFGPPRLPRFKNEGSLVDELRRASIPNGSFNVYSGPIASGDEDIVDRGRRQEVKTLTGALANGWEGAGGARACQFSGVPFVEVRGISDGADETAAQDFAKNLPMTMSHIARVITDWARIRKR